ncbi:MAG: TetR family transcriptional regulator C-terminal domain-containing protein [Burkholderiales bacterium]|nr:TetR family transcriptional regulator C-terminal domain-containing protein [Burkholderiales bacterium]
MARTADPTDIPTRLAAAGRELFSRQGYNATGIQQITDLAGVPKGSFYNHYASKEAFAAAIIGQYADMLRDSWATLMVAAPPEPLAAIRYAFAQMIAYHERAKSRAGCLVGNFAAEMAEASPLCRDEMAAAMKGWSERLTLLIRRAQIAGEVRKDISAAALAAFFWDAWEGALLRMKVVNSPAPLKQTVALMLDHLLTP